MGEVVLDFAADAGVHLAGQQLVSRVFLDPSGGFNVDAVAQVAPDMQTAGPLARKLDEVLWRFNSDGSFREQWRFPSNIFGGSASRIVVGSDGNVYYLQFGDKGIDIVRYASKTE